MLNVNIGKGAFKPTPESLRDLEDTHNLVKGEEKFPAVKGLVDANTGDKGVTPSPTGDPAFIKHIH